MIPHHIDCYLRGESRSKPQSQVSAPNEIATSFLNLCELLNNEGADFLYIGDINTAVEAFRKALDCISEASTTFTGSQEQHEEENSTCGVTSLCNSLHHYGCTNMVPKETQCADEACNEENQMEVVALLKSQGIRFPPVPTTCAPTTVEESIPFYLSVVTFNLALTFHSKGYDNGRKNVRVLRHALSLYNLCLKLIRDKGSRVLGLEFSPKNIVIEANLLTCALNNKAQIHRALSERDLAFKVNQELEAVISFAVDGCQRR